MSDVPPRDGVIWQVDPLGSAVDDRLAALGAVRDPAELSAVELAVVSFESARFADALDRLTGLRAVCSFGAGYDHLPIDELRRRGVAVSHTPDVTNDSVADLAVATMIDVLRGVTAADRFVRAGRWPHERFPFGRDFTGSSVGILGLGRVGRAVARRLQGFDVTVGYHNRSPVDEVALHYLDSPTALAAWADVLVVCVAGGPGTVGLVDADVLAALGPDGVLVNVSRGSVVDERALVDALVGGTLGGAALDVFGDEPHVPAELLDRADVVLTPHIASATAPTRRAMVDLVLDNVRSWIEDGELVTPIPDAPRP